MFDPEERASFYEIQEALENYGNEPCYRLEDVATKTEWSVYFYTDGMFNLSLEVRLMQI